MVAPDRSVGWRDSQLEEYAFYTNTNEFEYGFPKGNSGMEQSIYT